MAVYLWINPVAQTLYEPDELEYTVREKGFFPVSCEQNHIQIVKEKYHAAVSASDACVVDMRCPCAVEYIKQNYGQSGLVFPDIAPILIHSAYELSRRFGQEGNRLYITTPCTALKLQGERLQLPNTIFLTWNEFVKSQQLELPRKLLEASPIPPGFFNEFEAVESLVSKKQFAPFFEEEQFRFKKLVEALYCEKGCHNGDGILEEARF